MSTLSERTQQQVSECLGFRNVVNGYCLGAFKLVIDGIS